MLTAEQCAVEMVRFAAPCRKGAAKYRGKSPAQAWAKILARAQSGQGGDLVWLMGAISHGDSMTTSCACGLSVESMASMPLSMVLEALAAARKSSC